VIHVSDRTDVHVIFIALECVLSHMGGFCWWLFCFLVIFLSVLWSP